MSAYSDDQYQADYESRYPQFSDYQITDDMIAEHKWDRPARSRGVQTYESKYQTEQQDIPAYLTCQCGKCPQSAWPRKPQMRRCTIEDRELAMANAAMARAQECSKAQPSAVSAVESMMGGSSSTVYTTMDASTIMLVLTFIMFVFVCYCMKSIIEIKAQLKNQRAEASK